MIQVEEARSIILDQAHPAKTETISISCCLHRVLGQDIIARDNLPPFDKSAMDGYAIRSADTTSASEEKPLELMIQGIQKAGDSTEAPLQPGKVFKIMTGAPIPRGADSVIEFEKVEQVQKSIFLSKHILVGNNIIKQGEEIRSREVALEKGSLIRPAEVGVLASLGYQKLEVYQNPVVALISTGDELVDITSDIGDGKIRDSNQYLLTALLQEQGADVYPIGIVKDQQQSLVKHIQSAFEKADIVITSGGVSVGDYDFVQSALEQIGAQILFQSVAMKPGKPVVFARYQNKLFFGLPGNPLSVFTTFKELVKPAIDKIRGLQSVQEATIPVVLEENLKNNTDRKRYIYVRITSKEGAFYAHSVGSQSSSHLITLTRANGIVIIPAKCESSRKGDIVHGRYLS